MAQGGYCDFNLWDASQELSALSGKLEAGFYERTSCGCDWHCMRLGLLPRQLGSGDFVMGQWDGSCRLLLMLGHYVDPQLQACWGLEIFARAASPDLQSICFQQPAHGGGGTGTMSPIPMSLRKLPGVRGHSRPSLRPGWTGREGAFVHKAT